MKKKIIIILTLIIGLLPTKAKEVVNLEVDNIQNTKCIPEEYSTRNNEEFVTSINIGIKNNIAQFNIENLELGCEWTGFDIQAEKENNTLRVYLSTSVIGEISTCNCLYSPKFEINDIEPGEYDFEIILRYGYRFSEEDEEVISTSEYYTRKIYLEEDKIFFDILNEPYGYEYVPLIREGVIWTYKYKETMYYLNDYCHITFFGEEEIDGKIYKKCWRWNDDCSFNPETANLIAYMREENGKIYTYLKQYQLDLAPYIEHVSYDFNFCEIGYYAIKINFIGYETIDGTLRKKWKIIDDEYDYWNESVFIEGIGILGEDTEILPFPLSPIPLNGSVPPRLTLQTTMSGDIIFDTGDNSTNPCLSGYDYNPLVQEGKEWVYVNRNSTPENILRLTLYGTTEIEGKKYLNCWQYSDCEFNEETSTIIAYLREEDNKVYARYPNNSYEIDTEKEYCLYDFNIMYGEKYKSPFGDENYEYPKVQTTYYHYGNKLASVSTLLGEGYTLLMYEGIGFEGFPLPFPLHKEFDWKLLYVKENGTIMKESYWNTQYEDPCLLPGNVNLIYDDLDKIKLDYWQDNIVVFGEGDLKVGVYTLDGMKILESTGIDNVQLSTVELPIGIYIAKASVGSIEKSLKIVIK